MNALLEKIQEHLFWLIGSAVFLFFLIYLIWGENGILNLVELKRLKQSVALQNENYLKQNLLYLQEIEKLKKAQFVEQRVRTDLGFVRETETVYLVNP